MIKAATIPAIINVLTVLWKNFIVWESTKSYAAYVIKSINVSGSLAIDNLLEKPSIFSQRALQPLALMSRLMGVSRGSTILFLY